MASSLVQAALQSGVSPTEASQAAEAFGAVLAHKLAQGTPLAQATAQARQAFSDTAALPPARTAGDQAARSLSAASTDVGAALNSLSGARTPQGRGAFDAALSSALARGLPFEAATRAAREAMQDAERALQADAGPRAVFAGASEAGVPFAGASTGVKQALGSLLASGLSPTEALARAERAAALEAAAQAADARNPGSTLASASATALARQPRDPVFDRMLAAALARGEPAAQALARARSAYLEQQEFEAAESRRPEQGLSAGMGEPLAAQVFDAVARAALARGQSLAQALKLAREKALEESPPERATATLSTALATGAQLDKLPEVLGRSQTYRNALGRALAQGLDPRRALALARQAEQAATVNLPLPLEIRELLRQQPAAIELSAPGGQPVPDWIRFDPVRQSFEAVDIPQGGLPLVLVMKVGNARYAVTVHEIVIPGVPQVVRLQSP